MRTMIRAAKWTIIAACIFTLHYVLNKTYLLFGHSTPHTETLNFVPVNPRANDEGAREDHMDSPIDGYGDYTMGEPEVINPFPFKAVLIPTDPCRDESLYIFFYIYTAPRNKESRQLIRETWGDHHLYTDASIGYLFFMGLEENATAPSQDVIQENEFYDDIYVEDYIDSYFNLSRKGMSGMRYAHQHCSHVRRIVRSDDDVLIDVFHLIRFFQSEDPDFKHDAFLCRPQPSYPLRDEASKWFVSWEEWPDDSYPPVCNGFIYVMSPDVCGKLFKIALNTRYFKFEDVFITGSLMEKSNISKVNIGRYVDGKFPRFTAALHRTPAEEDFPVIFTLAHKNTTQEVKEVWDYIKAKYIPYT